MSKIKEHYHDQIEAGQRTRNEKPILFSTPMVQAILEGRKTQTRRVIKPQPVIKLMDETTCKFRIEKWEKFASGINVKLKELGNSFLGIGGFCPYGQPGDLLWVRERFETDTDGLVKFYASNPEVINNSCYRKLTKWKPSIHMPKAVARIWLKIKDVRIEKLQDISYADAKAEGVEYPHDFYDLWFKIHGPISWDNNPWVWVVEFEVVSTSGKPEPETISE